MERGFFKSVLTCICTGALCTTVALADVAPQDATRSVALTVSGVNGKPTFDAWVVVRTIDGQMNLATAVGQNYYIKNVGEKMLIQVTHPDFGTATIEAVMPMVSELSGNIVFTGQNRAHLELNQQAPVLAATLAQAESGGSDCCINNGSPGCDDPDCQAIVCGADPFCCDNTWDQLCADAAAELCGDLCGGDPGGGCEGGAGGCGDCGVPNPNGLPGCSDPVCEGIVCAADPFCCDTAWDGICADAALMLCDCAAAEGPSGDECDDPIAIGDGLHSGTTNDNTAGANDTSCAGTGDTVDEWYCYTASCTGTATASFCAGGGFADFDTSLSVFGSCGGAEIGCNDDSCGLQSEISWDVTNGGTYLIRVAGFGGQTGNFDLAVSCSGGGGGEGDECDTCIPIGEGLFSGSTNDNTGAGDDTSCAGADDVVDEWYCYTPSCDGIATASFCAGGGFADFDTSLAAYASCGGAELICNDDSCGLLSEMSWSVSAGVTSYIRVAGFGGQTGNFDLAVSINCGCESDDDCPAGQVCINGNCVPPPCDLECPAGALDEGEACGSDTNGGCNSVPPVFTDAACGDTFCGTGWADAAMRDTDWYSVNHGGGPLTGTVTSAFPAVCFILDGVGPGGNPCNAVLVGTIGCSDNCNPIADATADLPAGHYVVFVGAGDCAGGGVFEGVPCGGGNNDYVLEISCSVPVTGACCLEDGTCVDGVSQEECEAGGSAGCGDCDQANPNGLPGCSDPTCQDIVCTADPFCCDTAWDSICAGEAQDLCDCGGGGLGGEYQGDDTVCPGPFCIVTGGCCQCDGEDQFCTQETVEDCAALGGEYLGDFASCDAAGGSLTVTSSPNTAIPDDNPFGIDDDIVVGESFTVLDLEVQLDISHTWIGDLCVTLSKDGGEGELLMSRINEDEGFQMCHSGGPFGCSEDNMNVVLDDDAGSSIEDQCAAGLSGTYTPEPGSLAGFVGGDASGTWTLNVVDNAAGDVGTLVSWSLIFTLPDPGGTPCGDAFPDQCVAPQTLIIKQGACPAPVNPGSNGQTLMVLAGADDFDATDVDASSLSLSRCDGVGGSVAPNSGAGPPGVSVEDLNHPNPDPATCETGGCTCNDDQSSDGIDDLKLKFNTDEMAAAMDLDNEAPGTVITLVLSGNLNGGAAFTASDCIRIVGGGGSGSGALSVGSNLPGIWVDVTPLDNTLDDGGYTSFNRSYLETSVVTVTAPVVPDAHPNWVLANIWVDGVRFAAEGDGTTQLTIGVDTSSVILQYRQAQFNNPGITPGVGGNSQQW